MKKTLLFSLLAVLLCSCNSNQYTINGKLDEQAGKEIHLLSTNQAHTLLNTGTLAEDGSFTLKGEVETPEIALLANADDEPFAMFFLEHGKINIKSLESGDYEVTGTPANDQYKIINDSLAVIQARSFSLGEQATKEQVEAIQKEYQDVLNKGVDANLDNILGVYLFSTVSSDLTPVEIKERIAKFTPEMQKNEMIVKVLETTQAMENTEIGKPYIEINLANAEGQRIALSSLVGTGKWVLVDFWATWCNPCCKEIPFLRDVYATYKAKGFEIYGVSLDNNLQSWKAFLPQNNMTWINVIDIEEDKSSPASDAYGIRSIPSNFLISPDGIIVAKQLRGEALEAKLAELIK
ncbi:MAG: TlpA disulfide reductase family protein [Alistipes sp.]